MFRIVTAGIWVSEGLYVQIRDARRPQSPSLAPNTSNATIVLPASNLTLGDWGDANLGVLSETPVLVSNTPTGASDIPGGVGEVPTVVSDPPEVLPSSAPTIPSS